MTSFKSFIEEYEHLAIGFGDIKLAVNKFEDAKERLSKGVLLNEGKKLFYLNEEGHHIEKIFIEACLDPGKSLYEKDHDDWVNSRFPKGRCYHYMWFDFNAHVRGEYLTPHISYTLNLVFRYKEKYHVKSYNPLRYKIHGEDETKVFIIYLSTHMKEDGWFVVPLYQFTSKHKTAHIRFEFEDRFADLLVAGFEFQPSQEKVELQVFEEYQHIVEVASQSLFYTSLDELKQILSKGIHLNGYKTWFSLNEKGQHCVMISMENCLIPNKHFHARYKSHFSSSSSEGDQAHVGLKYRLSGESKTVSVYLAKKTSQWFYMAELYQFTSDGSMVDLEIMFDDCETNIEVEGILFQPLETVSRHIHAKSDLDCCVLEAYLHMCSTLGKRFQFNNNTAQEIPVMLSAREAFSTLEDDSTWRFLPEPRFGEVLVITSGHKFKLVNEIKPEVLSVLRRYECYFVYKLPLDQSRFESALKVSHKSSEYYLTHIYSYLVSPPNTPIIREELDENSYNPLNRHKGNALPIQRSDGWMEVKAWEFETWSSTRTVSMGLKLEQMSKKDLSGLIIYGIELRPI